MRQKEKPILKTPQEVRAAVKKELRKTGLTYADAVKFAPVEVLTYTKCLSLTGSRAFRPLHPGDVNAYKMLVTVISAVIKTS